MTYYIPASDKPAGAVIHRSAITIAERRASYASTASADYKFYGAFTCDWRLMMNKLPPVLADFLRLTGLPKSRIDICNLNTRLYHDLGIYGDAADDCLEVLIDKYHVDMTDFDYDRYFPPEFPGKTPLTQALIWFFPYIWKPFAPKEDKEKFLPLTLGMVQQAIDQKKWIEGTKLHM